MAEKAERDRKDAEARVALCYGEVSKDKAQELANAAINDVRAKMDLKSPPVDELVADRLRYLLGQHLNAESDDKRMPGFTRPTETKQAAAAVVACYDGVQQLMKEQVRAIEEAQRPSPPSSPDETAAKAPKEARPLPKPAERTLGRNSYEGCVIMMTATVRTVYEMEQVTEESCRKLKATAMEAPTFERQALTCTNSAGVMYNRNRGRLDLDPLPPEISARIMKGCIMMITDQSEAEYEAIRKRMQ